MTQTVSFIGLGAMGSRMSKHLLKSGAKVLVYNRTHEVALSHAKKSGTVAVSLSEAMQADVVFSCLPTSQVLLELLQGHAEHLKASQIWVDCTSGDPADVEALADVFEASGGEFLDAPVSGQTSGAEAATLTFMVGGAAEGLAKVRPYIECMASNIEHVGAQGAGYAVKAVNNAMLAANLLAALEGAAILQSHGVDLTAALGAINTSSGQSVATSSVLPTRILNRAFPLTFAVDLLAKDCRIAEALAKGAALDVPALNLAAACVKDAANQYAPGSADFSKLADLIEKSHGITLLAVF